MDMVLNHRVVLLWVVCLLFKVVLIRCEVTLVNRNVTDSFRVGKDGCMTNTDCPSSATCQSESGLCLCSDGYPNFLKHSQTFNTVYGCLSSKVIRTGFGGYFNCLLGPFQLIPFSENDAGTEFTDQQDQPPTLTSCFLLSALVKLPDSVTEEELKWLNQSYVDLTILNEILHFKWKRSVRNLQGAIITLNLHCLTESGSYSPCLRAKVLGTWPQEAADSTTPSTNTTISVVNNGRNITTANPSTSSAPSNSSKEETSDDDDDSNGMIIIIAVVVPVVLLIALIVVIWLLCGRKKRKSNHSMKKTATLTTKRFKHTDSTLRGPNAYEDGKTKDSAEMFGAQSNAAYSTLDRNTRDDIKSQEDPGYEAPDIVRKIPDVKANPFYSATPNSMGKGYDDTQAEPGYETPDVKRKEMNTPDHSTFESPDSNSDIKRVEVNGDLYALPNKETVKIDGLNYMDPSHLTPGSQEKNKEQNEPDQPTEYADIVSVMKPKPNKTGEKRKNKK